MTVPDDVREGLVQLAGAELSARHGLKAGGESMRYARTAVETVLAHLEQAVYGDGVPAVFNGKAVYWFRKN